ncbi:MAG TPA: malto-oligosyltrehalose trehalohydrolase [Usitatibacter sp.]|jgi:maltooligosyltrehalose trehalohydrolase|nr:malto-oligosyltrehalose trehalohydrolase [Usitatibacter sp.]
MNRAHSMPFGAEMAGGGARFRLWAPASPEVRLEIGRENPRLVPMQAQAQGWHGVRVEGLPAGTAYAFRLPDGSRVPDPASRSNPWDVSEPSALVDPRAFEWTDDAWQGRPWREAVVCEVHIGTFTPGGTFAAATARLDHLAACGVTAVEILPVADFAGRRGWGYDGVLLFAPDASYGTPDDMKRFVVEAHRRGLMVLLDCVYNHFGPEGNYLHSYAPQFFNAAHQTPWGAAINFDAEGSRAVRDFFVHNALYWIEEFHLDGLRLDAIHAIADDSPTHIVEEIARAIAAGPGHGRHVHLVLENDRNEARLLDASGGRPHATAQWNDDWHHAAHVLVTGERDGYYRDYAKEPAARLARALAEGFAYQGEPSEHRNGEERGEPSAHLPPTAFVAFLQNHDQVGNRAMGERIACLAAPEALRLAQATLLLAPSIPMLFMGEEYGATTPFLYFCDFKGELADAVREGRRREFAAFPRFADPAVRNRIPDPNAEATFLASKLRWEDLEDETHAQWLARTRSLLEIRRAQVVARLEGRAMRATWQSSGGVVSVDWILGDGSRLHLRANFGAQSASTVSRPPGTLLHSEGNATATGLGAWAGAWTLEAA